LKRSIGITAQRCDRLCYWSGIALDLRFELDRGVRKIVALKGFVGGKSGERKYSNEHGNNAGTQQRKHR
jgi:hypothetical protein